ncbi:hypothetical protein EON65_17660 [archaeon]|nr:MAG: hypothetical protein EON65_17660 [archaeon]
MPSKDYLPRLRKRIIKYVVAGLVVLSFLCTLAYLQWSRNAMIGMDHRRLTQSFAKSLATYEYDTHTYYAGTTVQLLLQILGDMHDNPTSYYHSPDHLDLILRSLRYSNAKLMHHRRHADRPYEVHAIGTASCGIKVGLHPDSIAGRFSLSFPPFLLSSSPLPSHSLAPT